MITIYMKNCVQSSIYTVASICIDNLESMVTQGYFINRFSSEKCEKLCIEKISFEPLSKMRDRFDLIETYKLVNNKYKTDLQSLFSLPYRKLRGHIDKTFEQSARTKEIIILHNNTRFQCLWQELIYGNNLSHIVLWISGIYFLPLQDN